MDDISHRLGCSKKTLYQHFSNRKELVLKVISSDMKKHEEAILKVIKENLHPIDEIVKLNILAFAKLSCTLAAPTVTDSTLPACPF